MSLQRLSAVGMPTKAYSNDERRCLDQDILSPYQRLRRRGLGHEGDSSGNICPSAFG